MKIKFTIKTLLSFLFCLQYLCAATQTVPLFTLNTNDNCAPSDFIIENVMNDAASYYWDLGNGETSTEPNPGLINYETPGNYTISLEVSTPPESRLITMVRILEAEHNDVTEPLQFYTQILDDSLNVIYRSPIVDRQDSITLIPHNALLDLNGENYRLQIWDFEPEEDDNLIGVVTIQIGWDGQASSVDGPLNVTVQILMGDAAPSYSHSVDFEMIQPFITASGNQLTVNAPISSTPINNTFTWYLDGVEIPNSDSLSITAIGSGIYTVWVEVEGGCEGLSLPFSFTLVNTTEVRHSEKLKVFPNPFKDELFVERKYEAPERLTVVDVAGRQIVVPWELGNGQIKLQTHEIPKGVYFLQLTSQEGILNSNLIIKQ